jgi:hypothetical protein
MLEIQRLVNIPEVIVFIIWVVDLVLVVVVWAFLLYWEGNPGPQAY